MGFRTVVVSSRAKLELRLNYLIVRGETEKRIFLRELDTLIIDSTSVAITSALLVELSKRKIRVIFCDEKHNPNLEMMSLYGSHDTSKKIKIQANWEEKQKANVWTKIVQLKIKKQMEHLRDLGLDEFKLLESYLDTIQFNDANNREGHSAKVYFNGVFGKEFCRDNLLDVYNSYLNYGYAILLSAFNREVISNGYITQIGLFHKNEYNNFNLSCDLMEPFRILIDKAALSFKSGKFSKEEKESLINIMNKEVLIAGKKQFLSNAIKIYCKSVFDAIEFNDVNFILEYYDEF